MSRQANVFSYHSSRSVRESSSARRDDVAQRSRLSAIPVWISAVAIVVACGYMLSLTATPRVAVVADQGSLNRSAATYIDYISDELRKSPLNYSKLTINTERIEARILEQFPELEAVSISIPVAAHRPVVKIVAGRPAFIVQSASNSKYYINNDGVALLKTTDIDDAPVGVLTLIDQSGVEISPGESILPVSIVSFVREITRQLSAANVEVAQLVLPASPNELQIRVSGQPFIIRFNTAADPRLQAGSYLAIADELRERGAQPQEYIDLRVEDRAYYK